MRETPTMKARTTTAALGTLAQGDLVRIGGEWLAVADNFAADCAPGRANLTFDTVDLYRLSRPADEQAEVARPEAVRLSKAQAEFLRLVIAGRIYFEPSNYDYAAPSHAHRDMFTTYNPGGRKSNRTLAGETLFELAMINVDRRSRKVTITKAAERWLAAHPA